MKKNESEQGAINKRLLQENQRVEEGGGKARQARQKRLGRLLARERIQILMEPNSFVEIGRHRQHNHASMDPRLAANNTPGDGIICGIGQLHNLPVAVIAHDVTLLRGAVGSAGAKKMIKLLDIAIARSIPIITLADSDGARVFEGVHSIDGWNEVMQRTVLHRTIAPHITIAFGLCVGAVAYNAMLGDFVGMVDKQSFMFITGPSITELSTGESIDIEALGGISTHTRITGACHMRCADEHTAISWAQHLLYYTNLPQKECTDHPLRKTPQINDIIPQNSKESYDVRRILNCVFDKKSLLELSSEYAQNLLTFMARIGGKSVVVLASQPSIKMGCLDIASSKKGAKILHYAQTHNLPVITLVDTTGYLPGIDQEHGGVLIEGAQLIREYASLSVPSISVTLRKCYGGASVLAATAQIRLALPSAEVAPMGVHAATHLAFGFPKKNTSQEQREIFAQEWTEKHTDPWRSAERGFFDAVIDPSMLRIELWKHLNAIS